MHCSIVLRTVQRRRVSIFLLSIPFFNRPIEHDEIPGAVLLVGASRENCVREGDGECAR